MKSLRLVARLVIQSLIVFFPLPVAFVMGSIIRVESTVFLFLGIACVPVMMALVEYFQEKNKRDGFNL